MSEPIRVHVDELTLDDMVLLEEAAGGKMSMRQLRDLLDRVVEGGAGRRKVTEIKAIAAAISKAVEEASNPKSS